jgi:hypothetical protein
MTSREQQNINEAINNARMIGFLQGSLTSYANYVVKKDCVFTPEQIAEGMRRANNIAEKWFNVRFEGPFMPEDISNMIKFEKRGQQGHLEPSDIVELERA